MLYEFGFQIHLIDIFKALILVLPFCIYAFGSTIENKIIYFITVIFAIVIATVIVYILYVAPICSYWKIKQYVNEGKTSVVEGEVSNFESPASSWGGHDSESFTINDVEFCYYGKENYGYTKFLCDGGVVTGNGQKLRITYCKDPFTNKLVICSIQEVE